MNFFKKKTSWSNIELGLLKVCVGSAYIIIGTYFHEFLQEYLLLFASLFFVTAIYTGYLWLKRIKTAE